MKTQLACIAFLGFITLLLLQTCHTSADSSRKRWPWAKKESLGKKIKLSNKKIVDLPAALAKIKNPERVYYLDLSNNDIRTLPANAFAAFINLTDLDISNNQFTQINVEAFNGLNKLKRLSLEGNLELNVSTLPDKLFATLDSLDTISFKGVPINDFYIDQTEKDRLGLTQEELHIIIA